MTNDHVYNLRAGRRTGARALGKLKQILGRSIQVPRKAQRSRNWHFEELENRLTPSALSAGILLLDPIGNGSLSVLGNATVKVTNGSVVVDSNNAAGAFANGSASISAPQFVFGGTPGYATAGQGQLILTNGGTIASGQMNDPLYSVAEPDPKSLLLQSKSPLSISGSNPVTLNPGVYQGGISITGRANVTLNPGVYYMQGGGFSDTGQGNLVGNDVMLYNDNSGGTINIAGKGSTTITPPATGPYQGISIFQDRNSNAPVSVTGNGKMNITGTFYAAQALLKITGNGSSNAIGSQLISFDLRIAGNGGVNVDWTASSTASGGTQTTQTGGGSTGSSGSSSGSSGSGAQTAGTGAGQTSSSGNGGQTSGTGSSFSSGGGGQTAGTGGGSTSSSGSSGSGGQTSGTGGSFSSGGGGQTTGTGGGSTSSSSSSSGSVGSGGQTSGTGGNSSSGGGRQTSGIGSGSTSSSGSSSGSVGSGGQTSGTGGSSSSGGGGQTSAVGGGSVGSVGSSTPSSNGGQTAGTGNGGQTAGTGSGSIGSPGTFSTPTGSEGQTSGTGGGWTSSPGSSATPPGTGTQTSQTGGTSAGGATVQGGVAKGPEISSNVPRTLVLITDAPNTTATQSPSGTAMPSTSSSGSVLLANARFPGTYTTDAGVSRHNRPQGSGNASEVQTDPITLTFSPRQDLQALTLTPQESNTLSETAPESRSTELVLAPSAKPTNLFDGSMVVPIPSVSADPLNPAAGPIDAVFSADDPLGAFQSDLLWKHLDALDSAFELRALDTTIEASIVLTAAAGYVLWCLCNSYLLASALATTTPMWKRYSSFDPLVILDVWEKESKGQKHQEDEETLQTLVSRASTTLKPVGI